MTFERLIKLVSSKNAPSIRLDSRLVEPGDIFAAIKGTNLDGHDFIDDAASRGAVYVIAERPKNRKNTEIIIVQNSAKAAALLAQAGKGNPASKLTNLAVTGTNGKTTVSFLVRSVIQAAGEKCGLIGTVLYDTGSQSTEANLTTPDCLLIAEKQQQMIRNKTKYMVIEASSHALDQNRLAGIDFKTAAFTNLTGDHLDYHKTEEGYLAVKTRLFEGLSPQATAVLNKQSTHTPQIAKKTKAEILWYAVDTEADLTGQIESMDISGTIFVLGYDGKKEKVKTSLSGSYNVSNHLAAAGLCLAAGFDLKTTAAGLSKLKFTPGRLEKIRWPGDFTVLIDYAHTDDALKNVLSTLKPLCNGKLIVVFGCGGDRDRTKRPRMAGVAEQFAGFIIVTSDNPRTEKSADIIDEIIAGFTNPNAESILIEQDREKAIESAIKRARPGDIVLIAGKGHETYQIIGSEKFEFSDRAVAEKYLERLT